MTSPSNVCARCTTPLLTPYKVRYMGRWYCDACIDPVNEEYLESMRRHQEAIKRGERLEDV